ncbi:MAG: hypothetical protein ACK5MV_08420 [Aminipila sp.]
MKEIIKGAAVRFFEIQSKEIKRSKEKEKIQLNINQDCFIGKEILYQTAILKEMQEQVGNGPVDRKGRRRASGRSTEKLSSSPPNMRTRQEEIRSYFMPKSMICYSRLPYGIKIKSACHWQMQILITLGFIDIKLGILLIVESIFSSILRNMGAFFN